MEVTGLGEGNYVVFFYGGDKFVVSKSCKDEIAATPWHMLPNANWVTILRGDHPAGEIESFTMSGTRPDNLTVTPVYRSTEEKKDE